jgi:nucleotide-binding universal stress UspA family protein
MYRIIIPLDGSTLGEQAVVLGATIARATGASIDLVHVLAEPALNVRVNALVASEEHEARMYLRRVRELLPDDLEVGILVERGHAADTLIRMAKDVPDTLIVMSTHGRGGLGRIVFGSIADKVMRGATVPVVLVRAATGHAGIMKMVVPLDGSQLAEAVLPLAVDLARQTGAGLHLVRVIEPFWTNPRLAHGGAAAYFSAEQVAEYDRSTSTEARSYLAAVGERLEADGVRPAWQVLYGKPAPVIAEFAEQQQADLILMSTHGLSGIRRWAFGSVTNEVVHRSPVPVLVAPSTTAAVEHEVERTLAMA